MSAIADVEQLIRPTPLMSFSENMPPVICNIWRGGDRFDKITLNGLYAFDTAEHLKRVLATQFRDNSAFLPQHVFLAIQIDEGRRYLAVDYLWYEIDTALETQIQSKSPMMLYDPRRSLEKPDRRFVLEDGSFPVLGANDRRRITLEDIYIKNRKALPEFYVFTLKQLISEYKGVKPISEAVWNARFRPYFPSISSTGPFEPTVEEKAFLKIIYKYVESRQEQLERLNGYLEAAEPVPEIQTTGVRQLTLRIQKPPEGLTSTELLFYSTKVTERRPFMRLIPSAGTPVSKVHVMGTLPIPTVENPDIILDWAKESSPFPGKDFFYMKYLHSPRISQVECPIYGTIRVYQDGNADILLQPPRDRRKLEPTTDFRNFGTIIAEALNGTPYSVDTFELGEASMIYSMRLDTKNRFTKKRLEARLPVFQSMLQQIRPLPEQDPIIALRYKAVSNFVKLDKVFSFITQLSNKLRLEGQQLLQGNLLRQIADEFQIDEGLARKYVSKWIESNGVFSVADSEENEFTPDKNPGIDIYIYAQHPLYTIHVSAIDSYESFQRIYTLLGLLFIQDDDLFKIDANSAEEYENAEDEVEEEVLERDEEEKRSFARNELVLSATESPDELADSGVAAAAANKEDMMSFLLSQSEFNTGLSASAAAAVEEEEEEEVVGTPGVRVVRTKASEDDDTPINPKSWFINKLQDIDPVLFKFTPKKSGDSYSRLCQANDDRQPSVLTQAQYDRMREEYAPDEDRGEIYIKEYPLLGTDDPKIPPRAEVYTVLKFGSDPARPNYYFCPPLFCLRDQIMIREKDFAATKDREEKPKPKDTCPFCRGELITDRSRAIPNHTVIRRKNKPKSTEQHLKIGFHRWDTKYNRIKDTPHPDELPLPCCGIKDHTLRLKYSTFDKFREHVSAVTQPAGYKKEEDEEDERGLDEIEFAVKLEALYTDYILGAEKYPLYMGKFAVVAPTFDKYFAQESSSIIQRTAIRQEIKRNSKGVIRVGVEQSSTESLLAVIAPLVNRSYIWEVKELILEKCIPRVFVHANFGNLVHEFYTPSDTPPTENELRGWASRFLQVDINANNKFAVQRIYVAYQNFVEFIKDKKKVKDLRHIAPLLAEPGLFTPRGLQLVVLDWDPANPKEDAIVRCPSYGLSFERHKRADFAFISRSTKSLGSKCSATNIFTTYELFVYTDNKAGGGELGDTHIATIKWPYVRRHEWPEIIQTRVDEFLETCKTRYTSMYTSQTGINEQTLITLSKAISTMGAEGIIRDSYNHAVALTFKTREKGPSPLVALPVVDDGHFFGLQLRVHLDWNDFTAASLDETVQFYREKIMPTFGLYAGYEPVRALQTDTGDWAIQLKNGIYVPCGEPTSDDSVDKLGLDYDDVEQFEWDINQAIASTEKCGSDPLISESSESNLEELYQHFRLMVANWLVSSEAGPDIRSIIEDVVFNKMYMPKYEKRKRVEILIGSELQHWFTVDDGQWELPTSFMRKDCRVIDSQAECTGACAWSSGKCRLHIKSKTMLGSVREVSTPMLFIKRVIDEIVNFPNRRKEILRGRVSQISSKIEAIRQGDQYIIPEKGADPFSMLRIDWASKMPEAPRYYEEMTRSDEEEEGLEREGEMPEELEEFLGEESALNLWMPAEQNEETPLAPFIPALEMSLEDWGIEPGTRSLTKKNLISYVQQMVRPIGFIDLREGEGEVMMARPFRGTYDRILMFVFLANGDIGLLSQFEGMPDVAINALPAKLREFWEDPMRVILVQVRKKETGRMEPIRILRRSAAPEAASAATAAATFKATPATAAATAATFKATVAPEATTAATPITIRRLRVTPVASYAVNAAPAVAKEEEITKATSAVEKEETLEEETPSTATSVEEEEEEEEEEETPEEETPVEEKKKTLAYAPIGSVSSEEAESEEEEEEEEETPEEEETTKAPTGYATFGTETEEEEDEESPIQTKRKVMFANKLENVLTGPAPKKEVPAPPAIRRLAIPAFAAPVAQAKPAVEAKSVVEAKPAVPVAQAKPAVEAKPAAPVAQVKTVAQVKPITEAKPAASVAQTKPAVQAKPTSAISKIIRPSQPPTARSLMQLKKSLEANSNSENSSENTNSEENAKPISRVIKKAIPVKSTSAAAKPVVSAKSAAAAPEVSNNVFDIPDYE